MPDAVTHHTCIKTQTEYELSLILKEIRFITDQVGEQYVHFIFLSQTKKVKRFSFNFNNIQF